MTHVIDIKKILPAISDQNPIVGKHIYLQSGLRIESFQPENPLILLVEEGSLRIVLNVEEHLLNAGSLIVLHPHSMLTSLITDTDVKAHVVAYDMKHNSMVLMDFTEYLPSLIKSDVRGVLHLSHIELTFIRKWLDLFDAQSDLPPTAKSYKVADHLLTAFHLQLLEIATGNASETERKRSRQEELMGNFLMALGKNVRTQRSVNFYASLLCVTPKHLSATIKEITGQTASSFINKHVITEAKVILRTSSLTIQQIAALLHFPNQSFFGKYFKKHTGLSPNAYRNMNS